MLAGTGEKLAGDKCWFESPLVGQGVPICELCGGRSPYECLAGLQIDRSLLLQIQNVAPNL